MGRNTRIEAIKIKLGGQLPRRCRSCGLAVAVLSGRCPFRAQKLKARVSSVLRFKCPAGSKSSSFELRFRTFRSPSLAKTLSPSTWPPVCSAKSRDVLAPRLCISWEQTAMPGASPHKRAEEEMTPSTRAPEPHKSPQKNHAATTFSPRFSGQKIHPSPA